MREREAVEGLAGIYLDPRCRIRGKLPEIHVFVFHPGPKLNTYSTRIPRIPRISKLIRGIRRPFGIRGIRIQHESLSITTCTFVAGYI